MKLVYIAGPIANEDPQQVEANIDYACEVAAKYWEMNYSVICPHANTRQVEDYTDNLTVEDWLQGDFEQLKRCDAIVLIDGWEYSKGARRELEVATQYGLEVIFDKPNDPPKRQSEQVFYFRLRESGSVIVQEEFGDEELAIDRYISVLDEEYFSELEESLPIELLPLENPEIELVFQQGQNESEVLLANSKIEKEDPQFEKIYSYLQQNHPESLKKNPESLELLKEQIEAVKKEDEYHQDILATIELLCEEVGELYEKIDQKVG